MLPKQARGISEHILQNFSHDLMNNPVFYTTSPVLHFTTRPLPAFFPPNVQVYPAALGHEWLLGSVTYFPLS